MRLVWLIGMKYEYEYCVWSVVILLSFDDGMFTVIWLPVNK
jgi:hypothetical protein